LASYSGVTSVITSGFESEAMESLSTAENYESVNGSIILAKARLSSKKRWVGFASGYQGVLVVNDCAKKVLAEKNVSLLSVGIDNVIGEFNPGDVVSIQDGLEEELGRGVCNFSSADVLKIKGLHTSEIPEKLGRTVAQDEVIHKDNLVIFNEVLI